MRDLQSSAEDREVGEDFIKEHLSRLELGSLRDVGAAGWEARKSRRLLNRTDGLTCPLERDRLARMAELGEVARMKAIYDPAGSQRFGTELKMFGVAPLHTKVSSADTDGRFLVCEIIGAGFGPPRHLHYEQDEWFFVTKGRFLIEVGGEQFDARVGDSVFAPRKVPHAWAPSGDGSSTLVFALQPAGSFEDFLRAASTLGRLPTPQEASAIFEPTV